MAVAGSDLDGQVALALSHIDIAFAPVPPTGEQRAAWNGAMDERLRRLAVKIAPGMSAEQAKEWRDVMVDALGDLPAMIALTAAKRAIHRPMRFLNEVETVVREIAAQVTAEQRMIRGRVEDLPMLAHRRPEADAKPVEICTSAQAAEILREEGFRELASKVEVRERVVPAPPVEPSVDDYLAAVPGMTREEAEDAIAKRRRLLSRSPSKPLGRLASAGINAASAALNGGNNGDA